MAAPRLVLLESVDGTQPTHVVVNIGWPECSTARGPRHPPIMETSNNGSGHPAHGATVGQLPRRSRNYIRRMTTYTHRMESIICSSPRPAPHSTFCPIY